MQLNTSLCVLFAASTILAGAEARMAYAGTDSPQHTEPNGNRMAVVVVSSNDDLEIIAEGLTELLISAAPSDMASHMVGREMIQQAMGAEVQSLRQCAIHGPCLLRVAATIEANQVVLGVLGGSQEEHVLTLEIIDVATGKTLGRRLIKAESDAFHDAAVIGFKEILKQKESAPLPQLVTSEPQSPLEGHQPGDGGDEMTKEEPFWPWPYVAGGVSGLGVVVGGIAWGMAASHASDARAASSAGQLDSWQDSSNKVDSMKTVRNASLISAGVAGAAGVLLWMMQPQ